MEKLNGKSIIAQARERLQGVNTRRLVRLHTGVAVGAALLIMLLQYVLTEGIGNTGGLSGMATRSVLETIQMVLQGANNLLIPFWNLGFLYVALLWAREKQADQKDLLTGFHRIGPCLGLMLNRAIMAICITILAVNLSSTIYMMMPASEWLWELTQGFTSTDAIYEYLYSLDMAQIMEMFWKMIPMVVISLVLILVFLIPLLYRFRLAEFVILQYPGVRGLAAMVISASLLRRRRWQLFKLDMRLWWYYGLKTLCLVVLYVGVFSSNFSGELTFLLWYLLYLAGIFAVDTFFRPQVDTAYAAFYEKLVELGPVPGKWSVPMPQQTPPEEE